MSLLRACSVDLRMLSITLMLLETVSSEYVNSIVSGHARVLSSQAMTVSVDSVGDLSPGGPSVVADDSVDESRLASDSSLMGTSDGFATEAESPIFPFSSSTSVVDDVTGEAAGEVNVGKEGPSTVGDIVVDASGASNVGAGDDRLSKVGAIAGDAIGELNVGDEGLLSFVSIVEGESLSPSKFPSPSGELVDADTGELISSAVGFCAVAEDEGLSPPLSSAAGSLGDGENDADAKSPYPSTVGVFEESKPEEVGEVGIFSCSSAPVGEFGVVTVGLNTTAGVGGDDEGVILSLTLSPSLSPPLVKSSTLSFPAGTELALLVVGCGEALGSFVAPGVGTGAASSSLPSIPVTTIVSLSPSPPVWDGGIPLLLLSDNTVGSFGSFGEVPDDGSDAVGEAPPDETDGLACVGVCPPSVGVDGTITDGADVDRGNPSSLPSTVVDGDPLWLPGTVFEPSVGVFSSVTTGSSDPPGDVGGVRSTDSGDKTGDETGACVTVTAGIGYHPLLSWEMSAVVSAVSVGGLLGVATGDSDGLGIASLVSSAGYPVGGVVTVVGDLVATCKIGVFSETETGAGAGAGTCGSTGTGAGDDTSSEAGTGIADGTAIRLSVSVGHRVLVMSEFSLCSDPSSMPLGGVVGASIVGADTSSLPSAPSVPPVVSTSESLPSTTLSLLLLSTLIVLSFAAAAAAASALSLALLFAISIILSTSPLKVKVSSLARRGFLMAWRGAS